MARPDLYAIKALLAVGPRGNTALALQVIEHSGTSFAPYSKGLMGRGPSVRV